MPRFLMKMLNRKCQESLQIHCECAGTNNMPIQLRLSSAYATKNDAQTWLSGYPYTKHMHVIN